MSKPDFFIEQFEHFLAPPLQDELLNNGVFCMMPWVHFHLTQYGTVAPCCVAPWEKESAFGNVNEQDIDSIWNSEAIRKFRLKMLNGEPDKRCDRCHTIEKGGTISLRNTTNNLYFKKYKTRVSETQPDGFLPKYKPVYLDIRFSNKCNFKCRICGPHSSSAWYDDAVRLGEPATPDVQITKSISNPESFFTQLQPWIHELEEVYFAGGEPLFIDEHYQLLDELLKAGKTDVLLRYSTNFSSLDYEKGKALDYWKKFKKVMVIASLDDMGERAELHRKGQNWKNTEQNIARLKAEAGHVHFMVSCTVSIWNIWNVCGFHRHLCEKGFIETDDFVPTVLEQPEYYSIKVLPKTAKSSLSIKFKEHAQWIRGRTDGHPMIKEWMAREFEKIGNSLFSEDRSALLPQLFDAIKKLDNIRREDTFETIPELKSVFENYPTRVL